MTIKIARIEISYIWGDNTPLPLRISLLTIWAIVSKAIVDKIDCIILGLAGCN